MERQRLQLPAGADALQTFEGGNALGDTRFLDFGDGLKARLVGDDYIRVDSTAAGACGPIVPTVLTTGLSGSPATTASVTIVPKDLVTLTVRVQTVRNSPGDNPPAQPPIIGGGLAAISWRLEATSSANDNGNLYRETLFIFSAVNLSSSDLTTTGTITVVPPPPGFLSVFLYEIAQWTNGGWIPQVSTSMGATQCGGVTYGAMAADGLGGVTPGAGFEELTNDTNGLYTEWSSSGETLVTFTPNGGYANPNTRLGIEIAVGTSRSGHIVWDDGVALPPRTILDFAGTGVTATDTGSKTLVTIPGNNGHVIQDESVGLTQRTNLNFTGAGVIATDDAGNDQTDITINATATINGHVIEDEGTPLTQRANMNFVGAGVAVTDAGGKTVVTIAASGGGDTLVAWVGL